MHTILWSQHHTNSPLNVPASSDVTIVTATKINTTHRASKNRLHAVADLSIMTRKGTNATGSAGQPWATSTESITVHKSASQFRGYWHKCCQCSLQNKSFSPFNICLYKLVYQNAGASTYTRHHSSWKTSQITWQEIASGRKTNNENSTPWTKK